MKSLGWLALGSALACFSVPGAYASLTPGWTRPLTIKNIVVDDTSAILIIDGGIPLAYLRDDCNTSQFNYLDISTAGGRAKLAVAMTAFSTGQTVQMALQACNGTYPRVTHIALGTGL